MVAVAAKVKTQDKNDEPAKACPTDMKNFLVVSYTVRNRSNTGVAGCWMCVLWQTLWPPLVDTVGFQTLRRRALPHLPNGEYKVRQRDTQYHWVVNIDTLAC